jgi:hypothetical protein
VGYAGDWAWSSVRAHLAGKDDGLVTVRPVLDSVSCFADLLLEDRTTKFKRAVMVRSLEVESIPETPTCPKTH